MMQGMKELPESYETCDQRLQVAGMMLFRSTLSLG